VCVYGVCMVCVCVYVCMYVCVCMVCVYVFVCLWLCVRCVWCVSVCVCVYGVCMVCVCVYVCVYVGVCMVCVYVVVFGVHGWAAQNQYGQCDWSKPRGRGKLEYVWRRREGHSNHVGTQEEPGLCSGDMRSRAVR